MARDGRASAEKAAVVITVVEDAVPEVSLTCEADKANPSATFACTGVISAAQATPGAGATFAFSLVEGSLSETAQLLYALDGNLEDPSGYPTVTTTAGGAFTATVFYKLEAGSLIPGASYALSLEATLPGRAPGGAVTPVFSANEAPTNTLVVVSPERGETPTVAFDVEATNCADVDLPLTYSFSHACSKSGGACDDLGGEYTALAETSFAARADAPLQSDLLLPAGYGTRGGEGDILVLVAYCYDALGAKGRAQKDAAISSPPKETQKAVAVANAETWIAESNATGDLDGVLRAIALTQSFLDEDLSERRRLDTCDPGFYGGDCSLNATEWRAQLDVQTTLFDGLDAVTAGQVKTPQANEAQAGALGSLASERNGALADGGTALRALGSARALAADGAATGAADDVPGTLVSVVAAVLGRAEVTEDFGPVVAATLDGLGEASLYGAGEGEAPKTVERDGFGYGARRVAAGAAAAAADLSSPGGAKAQLGGAAACGATAGESVDAVLATYDVSPREAPADGPPVSDVSRFTLHAVAAAEGRRARRRTRRRLDEACGGEKLVLEFPHGGPEGVALANPTPEVWNQTVTCELGEPYVVKNATCPFSGATLSFACNGTAESYEVECTKTAVAACGKYADGAGGWTTGLEDCEATVTENGTSCACDGSVADEDGDYAVLSNEEIYLDYVKSAFADPLDPDLIRQNELILSTLAVLTGLCLIAMAIGVYFDRVDERAYQSYKAFDGGPPAPDQRPPSVFFQDELDDGSDVDADDDFDDAAALRRRRAAGLASAAGAPPAAEAPPPKKRSFRFSLSRENADSVKSTYSEGSVKSALSGGATKGREGRHRMLTRIDKLEQSMLLRRGASWRSARDLDGLESETTGSRVAVGRRIAAIEQHQLLLQGAMPEYLTRLSRVQERNFDVDAAAPPTDEGACEALASERKWKKHFTLLKLSWKLLKTDHTLFNIFFVYRRHAPRWHRAILAYVSLVLIFWAEAVAAWYTNPYGVCESTKNEGSCENVDSPMGLFKQRGLCVWDPKETCEREPCDDCRFRELSYTEEALANSWEAFSCVLIAIPAILLFQYILNRYIMAPVRKEDRFWSAEARKAGESALHALGAAATRSEAEGAADGRARPVVSVGTRLLVNLGQLDEDGQSVAGTDTLELLSAPLLREVGDEHGLTDWYARCACVPTMRLILDRKRELADALEACDASQADRKQALEFLSDKLDHDWHCDRSNFPEKVTSQLIVSLRLARRYEARYVNHDNALRRSTAIYQLLLAQHLDHQLERHVYKRSMDMDLERELDLPARPVSLDAKVLGLLAGLVLFVGPIYFMLFYGRLMGVKETWQWWKVAMLAIGLIVFVVEPSRILFLNFILPKVLIPKMSHFSDPCAIPVPYRTPLPVYPADLVDQKHIVTTFKTARCPIPKRLRRQRSSLLAEHGEELTKTLERPLVRQDRLGALPRSIETARWRRDADARARVAAAEFQDAYKNDARSADHARVNELHRSGHARLWTDDFLFRLRDDLDFRPPVLYAVVLFGAYALAYLPGEVEEIVIEEGMNFIIMFGMGVVDLFLGFAGLRTFQAVWLLYVVAFGAAILVLALGPSALRTTGAAGKGLVASLRPKTEGADLEVQGATGVSQLQQALLLLYDSDDDLDDDDDDGASDDDDKAGLVPDFGERGGADYEDSDTDDERSMFRRQPSLAPSAVDSVEGSIAFDAASVAGSLASRPSSTRGGSAPPRRARFAERPASPFDAASEDSFESA